MKQLKQKFLDDIDMHLNLALSFDWAANLGLQFFDSPDADLLKGTAYYGFICLDPHAGRFMNKAVKLEDAARFAKDHSSAIIETFHGQMIQSWLRFLRDLYRSHAYRPLNQQNSS